MSRLTHIDRDGQVRMVDVTGKKSTSRHALATGRITMKPETFALLQEGRMAKGNVIETARIAGVMAAKRTADLIPMCHPLAISHVHIDFIPAPEASAIDIECAVRLVGRTGVEMEALTAVSIAALTIYDMCKAADREMVISDIVLMEKSGGKSGSYKRKAR